MLHCDGQKAGNLALRAFGFPLQENPSHPLGGWLLTAHDCLQAGVSENDSLASEHFLNSLNLLTFSAACSCTLKEEKL
jgi:hypothetical protein